MRSMLGQVEARFAAAMAAALGDAGRDADPLVRRAQDPKFGDFQSNVAMGLAKALGQKPRDIAGKIVAALTADAEFAAMAEPPEIAGPGFINMRLRPAYLEACLASIPAAFDAMPLAGASGSEESRDAGPPSLSRTREGAVDRLGIEPVARPAHVIVDYSGVNVAKQMHVGHIRSTIIGDVIARALAFEGHRVTRQNHVGDWGLQMGMMVRRVRSAAPGFVSGETDLDLDAMEREYRTAQAEEEGDPALAEESRAWVVRLQRKDPEATHIWQRIRAETLRACQAIYHRLNVLLTEDDVRGESFYDDLLAATVDELASALGPDNPRAVVREDQGALCVFHFDEEGEPAFKNPEGAPLPLIIRKSDGAFLYATTDLAAVRYRVRTLHADRIIYVTDARQALHFAMVFATARAAGWTRREDGSEVKLEHVAFGTILGEDRRPFKTRSGDLVKLKDLLDEAVARAEQLVRANEADPAKRRGFDDAQIRRIAEAVGVGAVKYADLAQNRTSDYVFSWSKMLATEGNTAPYLMYAYARIRSIAAKAEDESERAENRKSGKEEAGDPIRLREPAEIELAKRILQFAETIDSVADELRPNGLTSYLYELAGAFMKFYESCPVLKADTGVQRASRLALCVLTARTLRTGLDLLGIRVLERM